MAKLARNAFIEKHKQGTLVGFDFADFRVLKTSTRSAAKRPAKQPKKPQYKLLRTHEKATGKIFPTPNQIIAAMAKAVLKSDYFIESGIAGTVQALFIADDAEANKLADRFPHGAPKKGDGKPAKLVFSTVMDAQRANELARKLKLL